MSQIERIKQAIMSDPQNSSFLRFKARSLSDNIDASSLWRRKERFDSAFCIAGILWIRHNGLLYSFDLRHLFSLQKEVQA